MSNLKRHNLRLRRGFTLVELLVVIAMIGVLASIAVVGYRKYIHSARTSDAKAVMGAIRVAQESFRAETLAYQDCTAAWYPSAAGPTGNKWNFLNPGHGQWARWRALNVQTDAPTKFAFATRAVAPGDGWPAPVGTTWNSYPTLPAANEPGYVIEAAGDNDADGVFSLLVTTSINGEIYVEAEYE